ncbi:MAG: 4Fe-4S binding protein [Candidatus Firestonebacteria bacterium]|nr:4Fe-4S binding protein [Candidatus Firestonebacteria bacterium]
MSVRVLQERCPQSHACPSVRVCPVEALQQKGYAAPTVDAMKCTDCGACVGFCPMRALRLE